MTGTLHEDQYSFLIISRSFLLRMRNVSDKSCRGKSKHTFCVQKKFFPENRAVYEIMWENKADPDRPHMTIWHMRIACWIPKATNAHSEYVIRIYFQYQQCLYEPRALN